MFSYSGNPSSSDVDKYRYLISDVDEKTHLLEDEEIAFAISEHSTKNRVLLELFSVMADRYAKIPKRSLGPQSEDPSKRTEYFAAKVAFYRKKCGMSGIPTNANTSSASSIFKVGMDDNV